MPANDVLVHPLEMRVVERIDLHRRHGDQVEIADAGIEATGDIGAIEVDPDEVLAEGRADARDEVLEQGISRRARGIHAVMVCRPQDAGQPRRSTEPCPRPVLAPGMRRPGSPREGGPGPVWSERRGGAYTP